MWSARTANSRPSASRGTGSPAPVGRRQDDLARFGPVAAEVDDVGLVAEQRLLEVTDPGRPLLADLEPVAELRLAQRPVDRAHLLVETKRPACRPGSRRGTGCGSVGPASRRLGGGPAETRPDLGVPTPRHQLAAAHVAVDPHRDLRFVVHRHPPGLVGKSIGRSVVLLSSFSSVTWHGGSGVALVDGQSELRRSGGILE